MDEYTYQIHETENGTNILVFKDGMFERKAFVPVSEYRSGDAFVLTREWRVLVYGSHHFVAEWLSKNTDAPAKMISIGSDHQILSVSEYLSLHG